MRLNDRFVLEEYVPKSLFEKHRDRAVRWISNTIIEADLQLVLDLEDYFGREVSCTINNWKWGGTRQYSGVRVPNEPYYRETSLHAHGMASDKIFKFRDTKEIIPNKQVYDFVRENEKKYYAIGIRRIEDIRDADDWLHWDSMWTPASFKNKLQVVRA